MESLELHGGSMFTFCGFCGYLTKNWPPQFFMIPQKYLEISVVVNKNYIFHNILLKEHLGGIYIFGTKAYLANTFIGIVLPIECA